MEGTGTLFWENSKVQYKGKFKCGQKSGKGTWYHPDGSRYRTEWKEDFVVKSEKSELGNLNSGFRSVFWFSDQSWYEGDFDFKTLRPEGFGVIYDNLRCKIYEGNFRHGVKVGRGKLFFSDQKILYMGNFEGDSQNGEGRLYYANEKNSVFYEGEFKNGLREGDGVIYYENGKKNYEGGIKN
jgi:antitoxin component YwqK of YwqJK toxin-antitoxin module